MGHGILPLYHFPGLQVMEFEYGPWKVMEVAENDFSENNKARNILNDYDHFHIILKTTSGS